MAQEVEIVKEEPQPLQRRFPKKKSSTLIAGFFTSAPKEETLKNPFEGNFENVKKPVMRQLRVKSQLQQGNQRFTFVPREPATSAQQESHKHPLHN